MSTVERKKDRVVQATIGRNVFDRIVQLDELSHEVFLQRTALDGRSDLIDVERTTLADRICYDLRLQACESKRFTAYGRCWEAGRHANRHPFIQVVGSPPTLDELLADVNPKPPEPAVDRPSDDDPTGDRRPSKPNQEADRGPEADGR